MHQAAGISSRDLRTMARNRLKDAEVLLRAGRADGAYYICGYAVELALKARICRTLRWPFFPSTQKEFEGVTSLKTHDLETLLRFSSVQAKIRAKFLAEWSIVSEWNPEKRYRRTGEVSAVLAKDMLTSARKILSAL